MRLWRMIKTVRHLLGEFASYSDGKTVKEIIQVLWDGERYDWSAPMVKLYQEDCKFQITWAKQINIFSEK